MRTSGSRGRRSLGSRTSSTRHTTRSRRGQSAPDDKPRSGGQSKLRNRTPGEFLKGARSAFPSAPAAEIKDAAGFRGILIRRRGIGPVTDGSPARTSRATGDLIEDDRRKLRAMQFPAGWPEMNWKAPVECQSSSRSSTSNTDRRTPRQTRSGAFPTAARPSRMWKKPSAEPILRAF